MKIHSFHIPVMGVGFTIESPLKVAQYGIDSVVALADDILFEKLRKFYCSENNIEYSEINDKCEDFRALRITSYLNLMNRLVEEKFELFKNNSLKKSEELKAFFAMLPDRSILKQEFLAFSSKHFQAKELGDWLKNKIAPGSIDVNIMTKVDKENYQNGELLPRIYNDAHSALRGFAESDLKSSVVFSAGMNPRLYGYMEQFEDFYPKIDGAITKKIILKVSDYRSAQIQGRFLAKKGLWVSEYRIESGLNCGGHAFATEGFLLGPILEDFKKNRNELADSTFQILCNGLETKGKVVPLHVLPLKITAQGGVGNAEEHNFLIDHYKLDSVGWGSPFLLVPEATTVDAETMVRLAKAKEQDLYLSSISPLGVPFNNLRNNTKDEEKRAKIDRGRPGSACPKKYLALNKEFTEKGICTASRQYQYLKLKELKKLEISAAELKYLSDEVVDKSCICVGLGTSALINNNISTKVEGDGVSICPGPNMAYFSKVVSLKKMVDHIYGRSTNLTRENRPNLFIKELGMYIQYLKDKMESSTTLIDKRQKKYLFNFADNLKNGIAYYSELFSNLAKQKVFEKDDLEECLAIQKDRLMNIQWDLERIQM